MTKIEIKTAKSYCVLIENGLLSTVGEKIRSVSNGQTAAVISDDTVFSLYGELVVDSLKAAGFQTLSFVFPHGEVSKNLSTYSQIVNFLAQSRLSRTDVLIALGGGVVGDITGFAAATYLRGISFVQIPTTLLSAVDSSVGGKTAVDLPCGKNLVGAFYQPSLVLCDPDCLSSLPSDIFRDGCAEVIKYGMIDDPEFLHKLAENDPHDILEPIISTCVQMKNQIVSQDEFENADRRLLNFGHTFGHAIEASSHFSISHGSAVAIGMAMMTLAAAKLGYCKTSDYEALIELLQKYQLPYSCPYSAEILFDALCADKKVSGENIHLIVPDSFGHCSIHTVSLREVPDWLRAGGAL